jgi:hypothetical protein
METDITRVALVMAHLLCFAMAIAKLYTSDLRLLFSRPAMDEVYDMGAQMVWWLGLLWVTGLGVVWVDTGFELDKLMAMEKLQAKAAVVSVLTLNAVLLHHVVFDLLKKPVLTRANLRVMALSASVSSASWTYAAFLGIAKPLAVHLGLSGFLALYSLVLGFASAIALALVPWIARNWEHYEAR